MLWVQLLLPAVCGISVLLFKNVLIGRVLLVTTAVAHLGLTMVIWNQAHPAVLNGWLAYDEIGKLFLAIVSVLFLASAVYVIGYLSHEHRLALKDAKGDAKAVQATLARSERIFLASLLFFLSTMTMVTVCQHFELLWVAIEATTLASAPLVYFHRGQHALEATWKYLIICSFGIALALLGNFLLAVSASRLYGGQGSMLLGNLTVRPTALEPTWLKAAFIFLFVGYGTKMGLAPLHTWLPDAHSEAPSAVSSLLSGALLGCAFLGILRAFQVCIAAGIGEFAQEIMVMFGLLSMAIAAIFIIRQQDFKRMLAYSSVEHMGILCLSVGLGGAAVFGGMLHAIGHSLIKAMLFLVAGNILVAYHSKSTKVVCGVLKTLPVSGALWFLGMFAITGFPPFGLFTSELLILRAALEQGRYGVSIAYLVFLSAIFIGMVTVSLPMMLGQPAESAKKRIVGEWRWTVVPPLALALLSLVLGPHVPSFLRSRINSISGALTVQPVIKSAMRSQ